MNMKTTTKGQIARGILPYVATILSISLAVTLRVEHACTDNSNQIRDSLPSTLYPYSEMIARRDSVARAFLIKFSRPGSPV
jgi:hypothetical protein